MPETQTIWAYDTKNGLDHAYIIPTWVCNLIKLIDLPEPEDRLFSYSGRSSIYTPWRNTCTAAGIEYVTPHNSGRRSMVTEVVDRKGKDIKAAQDIGNWRSKRVLREHYVMFEKKKEQSEKLFPEPDWSQFDSDVVVPLRKVQG